MASVPYLSSSEDELQSQRFEGTVSPRSQSREFYVPKILEPGFSEGDTVKPVPGAQKRKFDANVFPDEPSLLSMDSFPPLKKSNIPSSTVSGTSSNTTNPKKTKKQAVKKTQQPPKFLPSSTSSGDSYQSSLLSPTHTVRRRSALYEKDGVYVISSDDEDKENKNEAYAIPENERATVVFDFDREREKRLAVVVSIPEDRYTEKEKSLFLQLALRGFEPLAPKHWQFDFPTLPDSLFPEEGREQADPIIKISKSTTFHAIKSLGTLFSLSGRVRDFSVVRDCGFVGKRPENIIKQTIVRYIRWALFDVNLEIGPNSAPIHLIYAQRKHETVRHALERLNKRLKRLALKHQKTMAEAFGSSATTETPLLNGFLICGPVVAIMTFDVGLLQGTPEDEEIDGKFFSQFDFSERGQDLWNSLALAIVIMHIRNTMVQLSERNYGGYKQGRRLSVSNEDL
ncbi:uncharacterized protein BDV14DRAFT_166778 [Aspergillus stella-maris]|uniref:uncharacterized protein n=1 Tax=Aspergillus stella-maris TaxID=1810926 RepID=UPI003CCD2B81